VTLDGIKFFTSDEDDNFMWDLPFPCPDTARLCSDKGDAEIRIDRESWGVIRSETGKIGVFLQNDDGFASLRWWRTPCGDSFLGQGYSAGTLFREKRFRIRARTTQASSSRVSRDQIHRQNHSPPRRFSVCTEFL
jgi:hypothetical protein